MKNPCFSAARYQNLWQPLAEHAGQRPGQTAVHFYHDDESVLSLSYREIHDSAVYWAAALAAGGTRPGDIVVIALRHCPELVHSFWGALYHGAVPSIFQYKGPMTAADAYIERVTGRVRQSGAKAVITLPEIQSGLRKKFHQENIACRVLAVESGSGTPDTPSKAAVRNTSSDTEIAYIQYSSGTSGEPKGVMLSHRAILNAANASYHAMKISKGDVSISWLPFSHDFGLFCGFVYPLLFGIPAVLISPFKWLRKPLTYLRAIQDRGGTISYMPNSAHTHTVKWTSDNEMDGLDLSSLRLLINGSEPPLEESQELFYRKFKSYGFQESALVSGYGMAENTLSVTFVSNGGRSRVEWIDSQKVHRRKEAVSVYRNLPHAVGMVSSGTPLMENQVSIVDEHGHVLPERRIGEIIVQSTSLFSGYHRMKKLTRQVLTDKGYATGDVGYLSSGELFVCGRKKDLIIVGGQNISPDEIEKISADATGYDSDTIVAFGIPDRKQGTEAVIVLCGSARIPEPERQIELTRTIRKTVFDQLEITIRDIRFIRRSQLKKTANGKIARQLNRLSYLKSLDKTRTAAKS